MSIKDSIQKAKDGTAPKGMFKNFYRWYDSLTPEDQNDLKEAILSEEVSIKKLFYALKENQGVPFGEGALYQFASKIKSGE